MDKNRYVAVGGLPFPFGRRRCSPSRRYAPLLSGTPPPPQEDVSAFAPAVLGRSITAAGVGLLAVGPFPSAPFCPLLRARSAATTCGEHRCCHEHQNRNCEKLLAVERGEKAHHPSMSSLVHDCQLS